MFYITQSQRIDVLLASMLQFLQQHPPSVFEAQQILVPSHGVGVWLRLNMAARQQVCAQVATDFLGSYQWNLYSRVLKKAKVFESDTLERAPLSANVMQWQIFGYLTDMHDNPDQNGTDYKKLEPLLNKMLKDGSPTQIRRQIWGLSEQVAQVFAAYVVYRPEWLKLWSQDKKIGLYPMLSTQSEPLPDWLLKRYIEIEPWQALLWRQLFAEVFAKREQMIAQFWQLLAEKPQYRQELPRHLTVFGLVKLPPAELLFLRKMAHYIDVHVLHYNPSQEYWADTVDPQWLTRYAERYPERAALRDSHHRLLTRMGKQARDVFAQLVELSDGVNSQWQDVFVDDYPDSLLGQIQRDILYLNQSDQHIEIAAQDRSLQVHGCHSVLRQLEVLHDELLAWLNADPQRQPADILILTPNLTDHAPLIRAVFSTSSLPVEITGLATPDAESLWQALSGRVGLLEGRFTPELLLDWLSLAAVQRSYQLSHADVQRGSELLAEARFYRGFDAAHLAQTLADNDRDDRFCFRRTLDRLLLGIAMPTQALHGGVLAWPLVQPSDFGLIAVLDQIYHDLDQFRTWLSDREKTIPEWLILLRQQLRDGFAEEANSRAWDDVQRALDDLDKNLAASSHPHVPLPLRFVLDEVQATLAKAPLGSVPTGKITFAPLGNLRPLPYQLVVMIGLDAGQFPSRDQKSTFDLMPALPSKLGDRSRFDDDHGAFLEGLLLAQQACWIFYNAFDVADKERRQPAGPVQELLDFVARLLLPKAQRYDMQAINQVLKKHIIHEHTLLPFEADNFRPNHDSLARTVLVGDLAQRWHRVASHLLLRQWGQSSAVWAQRQPTQATQTTPALRIARVELAKIIGQLQKPARYFLQQMGIDALHDRAEVINQEPMDISALDQYQMRAWCQQHGEQQVADLLLDRLPVGAVKDAFALRVQRDFQHLAWRTEHALTQAGKTVPDACHQQILELDEGDVLIEVPVQPVDVWVAQGLSSGKKKHRLRAWLEHLAWQIARNTSVDDVLHLRGRRVVVFAQTTLEFRPVEAAQARSFLSHWLAVWQLSAQSPWVLPPDLVLHEDNGIKQNSKNEVIFKKDDLIQSWLGEEHHRSIAPNQDTSCAQHPDWRLILQGQDAKAIFVQFLEQHAARLYLPLIQHEGAQAVVNQKADKKADKKGDKTADKSTDKSTDKTTDKSTANKREKKTAQPIVQQNGQQNDEQLGQQIGQKTDNGNAP